MYAEHLRQDLIPISAIYLDPNNPRFWSDRTTRDIPDRRIPEASVQAQAFNQIQRFGITELRDSILRNGFLPLDRIVVRPIEGHDGKYVIVEGNRRFAALTTLRKEIQDGIIDEEGITPEYLQDLYERTDRLHVLIYEGGDTHDISWLLQGIRHISGIRNWEPAQRARLLAEKIDKDGLTFTTAGQMFGLSARAVGRLYRAYKALEQMRTDEEFQSKAKNEYFTLFDEAYKNSSVREWLGWDDEERCFLNSNHLKRFYSWITPDDDHPDQERRIHDPRQIKELGYLIAGGHDTLMELIDQHEIGISEAYGKATGLEPTSNWKEKIEQARRLIADLPQKAITDDPIAFLEELAKIEHEIFQRRVMAEAVQQTQ